VGTISRQRSQTSSLINQRSRPTYANQMCFYPRLFVDVDRRFSAAPTYTRTLSPLSLSVSPCVCPLSVLYKNPIARFLGIIEIQDFSVTGCSYSIGSTNTKLCSRFNIHARTQVMKNLKCCECVPATIFRTIHFYCIL
jgi:hypothetical protein